MPCWLTPTAVRGLRTNGSTRAVAPVLTPSVTSSVPGTVSVLLGPTPAIAHCAAAACAVVMLPIVAARFGANTSAGSGTAPNWRTGETRTPLLLLNPITSAVVGVSAPK